MRLLTSFSFRQLLVLAFLLLAALLAIASLHGLQTQEQLVKESRESLQRAVAQNADVQLLAERRVAMERAARQYLILGEPTLQQRFTTASKEAQDALKRLQTSLPADWPVDDWRAQVRTIARVLNAAAPGNEASASAAEAMAQQREAAQADAALIDAFRRIDVLNADAASAVRAAIKQQNEVLLAKLERGRHRQERQLLIVSITAVLLALALGYWLSRPVKRLEQAIDGLGENRLDDAIEIGGPADLRSLGRRLDWLRRRLSEVEADKARFLRHVSHELKTPLAALREGASLLEEGVAGPLNERQAEVVKILRQHTLVLQSQIEDLLRFNAAAFEARTLSPRPVQLAELVDEVIADQRLQWQNKQLAVSNEGAAALVEIDREKFATAIANLLSNAIRFSPPGGSVRFRREQSPEGVVLEIADDGPGIAEEDRERIFEPFYRGRVQPESGLRGSGIGLSIVQEYIRAHGGRIMLMPAEKGARFRIELPHVKAA